MQRTHIGTALSIFCLAACSQQFDLGIKSLEKAANGANETFDEYLVQVENRKVDLLFVIDNSGSMQNEINTVRDSFSSFISSFVGRGLDYNIGVTTTDVTRAPLCTANNCYSTPPGFLNVGAGSLVGFQDLSQKPVVTRPKILSSTSMPPASIVESFKENVALGTGGSGGEAGLAAAIEATQMTMTTGFNSGFLRPEARLNVIILSDEDESYGFNDRVCPFSTSASGGPCRNDEYLRDDVTGQAAQQRIDAFHAHMNQVKDALRPDLFRLDIISGDPDFSGACTAQARGETLKRAVQSYGTTQGRFIDLCKGDFAPDLASLGSDLSGQIEHRFKLKHSPKDSNQIRVSIDDIEIQESDGTTDGFKYTPSLTSAGVDVGGTVELIGLGLDQRLSFKVRIRYHRAD